MDHRARLREKLKKQIAIDTYHVSDEDYLGNYYTSKVITPEDAVSAAMAAFDDWLAEELEL